MLTCRHCKEPRTFDGRHDRHGHVIFGQEPGQQAARATLEAINHLQIRHPEAFAQMNNICSLASGVALAAHIEYEGPEWKLKHQRAAAEIVRAFGRVITDDEIEKGIRTWRANNPDSIITSDECVPLGMPWEAVGELLRQIRDTLAYADVLTASEAPAQPVSPNGDGAL